MKFYLEKNQSGGPLYVATSSECSTEVVSSRINSKLEVESIKDLISVHWSHTHSPRAKQFQGSR